MARGGQHTDNHRFAHAGTNNQNDLGDYAIYNSGSIATVRSKSSNALGLFDMSGNMMEWCWDWYGSYPSVDTNPESPETGSSRVKRGGGYNNSVDNCRVANRHKGSPRLGKSPWDFFA